MDRSDLSSFGTMLKAFRTRRGLTQQQLAEQLGVRRNTIGTWERGDVLPGSKGIVLELAKHLHLDDQEIRHLLEASLTALSPSFLVPFLRNPFFTGREEILEALQTHLGTDHVVALTQSYALHGLGGIGKTQIALEYAYRHALEYSAVFWIEAETGETVVSSLLRIAELLQLSERQEANQQRVVVAVQRWLSGHSGWLLIWDNVEDLSLLDRFLPSARSGAILITTRCQTLGTLARGLDLLPMEHEEGILFLLRRAKVLEPDATREQVRQLALQMPPQYAAASELVMAMGGLPLALDQAGAYLEATHCGLPAYLELFRTRCTVLLEQRGEGSRDHPASVSTTFTLAIAQTAQRHPAVQDLLRVCALLQPDAIPEELFCQGGEHLGAALESVCRDPLDWDRVVAIACAYSLLSRQPGEQTLSLHRLVQAVLLDTMTEAEREQWTGRAMSALDLLFPDVRPATGYAIWKQCERLQLHALLCLQQAEALEESLTFASLAYKMAQYLRTRGRYTEAEPLYQRALHVREQAYGPDHSQVAPSLNDLAILYWCLGKYEQAEPLYRRALRIWGQSLGPNHPQVGALLNNLGFLYRDQGKYVEAEPHYLRALQIWEQSLGPDHPDVAHPLVNLAILYRDQGRYAEAEPLALQALSIREQSLGPDHPLVASALNTLAFLYRDQGRYAEAEPLALRALSIRERYLGLHHPETAQTLHDLAILRQQQGQMDEAIFLAERALSIRSQPLGKAHPKTVATQALYEQLLQEQPNSTEPTIEHIRTILKARGWSVHLKKQRSKSYVYATRKVGGHTQSRYLAPLSNLAACLAAARVLPNAREGGKANGCPTERD
jgi:tetratricopeptide (TPR) repeat protein